MVLPARAGIWIGFVAQFQRGLNRHQRGAGRGAAARESSSSIAAREAGLVEG